MSSESADRNLLLGALALQLGFVDRGAFVAAATDWVADKARPFGALLVARGLSAARLAKLEALVEEHLAGHGGDPRRSLAAAGLPEAVRKDLERLGDPRLTAALAAVLPAGPAAAEGAAGAADAYATRPPREAARDGARFQPLRFLARGGMGEVWVARDAELSREVALKEIQPKYAADPVGRARFLREAEITGRLEHPGVVPVYGLGRHPDGRPYYAMRLIGGVSLEAAVRDFHDGTKRRRPEERSRRLRELLRAFVGACLAVAHAHGRGVLHRDLTPGNVMLGDFGEVLVIDWGLAKAAGVSEVPFGGGPAAAGPSGAGPTLAGSRIGTPAYMSPEQAAGRLDRLGPASDVYGLGAILFAVLTGRPPADGERTEEVLRRASAGEIPSARSVAPWVPKPLEAVCAKALAFAPADRYASARDLADEVERWLADEPVTALPETPLEKASRWARRHKTETGTAVAAGFALLIAAGTFGWWYQTDRAERAARDADLAAEARLREEDARRDVADSLARAAELRDESRWPAARALLAAAGRRAPEAGDDRLAERVRRATLDLETAERLEAIRFRKAAEWEEDWGAAFANGRDGAFADVFERYLRETATPAVDLWASEPAEVARSFASSAIAADLVAALDNWAGDETDEGIAARLAELARRADPDPVRDRLRDPAVAQDPQALAGLARELDAGSLPAATFQLFADRLDARKLYAEATDLRARALSRHPDDFWLCLTHAWSLRSGSAAGRLRAEGYFHAALAARPDAAVAYNNLGQLLEKLNRPSEAERQYRAGLERDPDSLFLRSNLGWLLLGTGRADEAEAEFRRLVEDRPEVGQGYEGLGRLAEYRGRKEAAADLYRTGVGRVTDPSDAAYLRTRLAWLFAVEKPDEAEAEFRRAIESRPDLGDGHAGLGWLAERRGRVEEAERHYRKAAELEPDDESHHGMLADLLLRLGREAEAERSLATALWHNPRDAGAYETWGVLLARRGRTKEAEAAFRRVIEFAPLDADLLSAAAYRLQDLGLLSDAETFARRSVEINPSSAMARSAFGFILLRREKVDEAVEQLREAARLDPSDPTIHANLTMALAARGDKAAAAAAAAAAVGSFLANPGAAQEVTAGDVEMLGRLFRGPAGGHEVLKPPPPSEVQAPAAGGGSE